MTNAEPTVPEKASAIVIPFPQRPANRIIASSVPSTASGSSPEHARLTRALESLNAALAEQREAVKTWRSAMAELKSSTTALEGSLHRYRGNLRSLGNGVSALHQQALALEALADGAMKKSGSNAD